MTELTVPPKQLLTAPWYKAAEKHEKRATSVYSSAFGSCNFSSPPVKVSPLSFCITDPFLPVLPEYSIHFDILHCQQDNYTPKCPIRQVFIPY